MWNFFRRQTPQRPTFAEAISTVDRLLKAQGIGSGAGVTSSGERGVFALIDGLRPTLVDVGGHVGAYSAAFLSKFPNARVLLVEPSAHHLALAKDRLGSTVSYLPVALSDRECSATLFKTADVSGLASLTKRRLDHFGIDMHKEETVHCRTLDSVCHELGLGVIDLLKLDVEGHELDVLNGSVGSLAAKNVKLIQFEFGGCNLDTRTTLQDFFYLFHSYGYTINLIQPEGSLVPLPTYEEIYEQYRTTNYLARLET